MMSVEGNMWKLESWIGWYISRSLSCWKIKI